ncbi:hypothetical protein AX16_009152 [Volvariella volvacea WC 439]|nr:hypothetical protein AX16_009152 [Volvariella volvacea WC 439]
MSPFFTLPHIEDSPKRVRVLFGGKWIIDTRDAKLVWEKPNYPLYFFHQQELDKQSLEFKQDTPNGAVYDIVVDGKRAPSAVTCYNDGALAGLLNIRFSAVDAWFEEDEQIFVHPKDPYKRVDVLQSSRHVRVEVSGVEVANTRSPRFLYETSLPVRTYIPKIDCRLDLMKPSDLRTQCPYKGEANYYHVRLPSSGDQIDNIVWWYPNTTLECAAIRGYVAFYDEKVDVWIDGVKQSRPHTPFA